MATVVSISEFLKGVSKLKPAAKKVEALKENDRLSLQIVLQAMYDPNVVWALPEGDPPYKPCDIVDQQHIFHKECDKIKYFIKGFNDTLPKLKREAMFVEFIERLDPEDAKLVLGMKDKKWPPGYDISRSIVKEAFPGLIPE